MKYTPTTVAGVTIIDIEPDRDHRGFVSQSFCATEFSKYGITFDVSQMSVCFNYTRGTMRGLHRQAAPHVGSTLVRCTRGAIAAVAVDVRSGSEAYGSHVMIELSAENRRALFLPAHVAHGFQTLIGDTEVMYQVSGPRDPAGEQGYRWSEPEFGIEWPLPVTVISEQDASWPYLKGRQLALTGAVEAVSPQSVLLPEFPL